MAVFFIAIFFKKNYSLQVLILTLFLLVSFSTYN